MYKYICGIWLMEKLTVDDGGGQRIPKEKQTKRYSRCSKQVRGIIVVEEQRKGQ